MYLSIVQIFLHVLDNDSLSVELIIDPLDEDADEILQSRVVVRLGLNHGSLLVLLKQILLRRDLR